jgi:hypothetical protein
VSNSSGSQSDSNGTDYSKFRYEVPSQSVFGSRKLSDKFEVLWRPLNNRHSKFRMTISQVLRYRVNFSEIIRPILIKHSTKSTKSPRVLINSN